MPALVAGIYVHGPMQVPERDSLTWMAGTSPAEGTGLVAQRHIYCVGDSCTALGARDSLDDLPANTARVGNRGIVRCDRDSGVIPKGVAVGQRFDAEYVQRGMGQTAGLKRRDQIIFHQMSSARRVYQMCAPGKF